MTAEQAIQEAERRLGGDGTTASIRTGAMLILLESISQALLAPGQPATSAAPTAKPPAVATPHPAGGDSEAKARPKRRQRKA